MGTTAQTFYLPGTSQTNWDGTDPASGDVRKLRPSSLSEADATTVLSFPTAASSIVFDPYTNRSTTGTGDADRFGWAINLDGADGLEATSTTRRLIPAGVWTMNVDLNGVVVGTWTITVNVYRISRDGTTRTLLFSATSGSLIITAAFTSHQWFSASQPAYTIAADESILCSFYITKTATATAQTINVRNGNGAVGSRVALPSGIRTEYLESHNTTGRGTLSRDGLGIAPAARDLQGHGVPTIARSYVGAKTFDLEGDGVASRIVANTKPAVSLVGEGTTGGRVEVPFDEIPPEGGTVTVTPLFLFDD